MKFTRPPLADEIVLLRACRADEIPAKLTAFVDQSGQRVGWPQTMPYTEEDARSFFAYREAARRPGGGAQLHPYR